MNKTTALKQQEVVSWIPLVDIHNRPTIEICQLMKSEGVSPAKKVAMPQEIPLSDFLVCCGWNPVCNRSSPNTSLFFRFVTVESSSGGVFGGINPRRVRIIMRKGEGCETHGIEHHAQWPHVALLRVLPAEAIGKLTSWNSKKFRWTKPQTIYIPSGYD